MPGPEEDSTPPAADRSFRQLDADQPGGPRHRAPFNSEPTSDQVADASRAEPTRRDAETFAVLVSHAIEDQTEDSIADALLNQYVDELPADSVRTIKENRDFPGNRVVPGSRSFVRSLIRESAEGYEAVVLVVEKIESPTLGDAPDQPFVFWAQSKLVVVWSDSEWALKDYQSAGASEYPEFSKWTWRGTMNSGRDWRRFDVAG